MRKIHLYILLIICTINFAIAQKPGQPQTEEGYNNYPYSIGPYLGIKAGVNAHSVPQGVENGVAVNELPDFGIHCYLPLSSQAKFGVALDLLFSNYFYRLNNYFNKNLAWPDQFKYFTFGANIHITGFMIGLNAGLPIGGKSKARTKGADWYDVKSEDLGFLVEFRLGGMFPLYENETGRLNVVLFGGYFLTGVYDGDPPFWGEGFNPHPATLSLGLNYLFNLNHPGK